MLHVLTTISGTLVTIAAALGILWHFALPWLRAEILEPIHETRKQVAENHHTAATRGEPPTVLDKVDDVQTAVVDLHRTLERHIEDSSQRHADSEARLARLERRRRLF